MANILLIGGLHNDQDIVRRAANVLEDIRPSAVTVEAKRANLLNFQSTKLRVLDALRIVAEKKEGAHVSKYLVHQFENVFYGEAQSSLRYCSAKNIPFAAVDHPGKNQSIHPGNLRKNFVRMYVNLGLRHLLDIDGMRAVVAEEYDERMNEIRGPFTDELIPDWARPQILHMTNGDIRDAYPAACILQVAKGIRGTLVHFCGINHLLDDPKKETVYAILKEKASVERAFLCDFDS